MWNGEKPRQERMWIFEECQLWWVCGWRDGEFGVIPLECQTSAELCMPSGACICQIRWYSGTFVTCTNKCVLLFCVDTQECYPQKTTGLENLHSIFVNASLTLVSLLAGLLAKLWLFKATTSNVHGLTIYYNPISHNLQTRCSLLD